MMIEAPQLTMTNSKKEEVVFPTDQTFKTPNEDKSEPPSHEWVTDLIITSANPLIDQL